MSSGGHPDEERHQDGQQDAPGVHHFQVQQKTRPQHCRRLSNGPTQQQSPESFTELMERKKRHIDQFKHIYLCLYYNVFLAYVVVLNLRFCFFKCRFYLFSGRFVLHNLFVMVIFNSNSHFKSSQ